MNLPNPINAAELNRALASPATRFAGYVQHFAVVDSTNDLALKAAQAGKYTGVWSADEQTAGRGRGGHVWLSLPTDGLYLSVLLNLHIPAQQALRISLATGLAAQSAVEETCGLRVDLRWPNDLLLNGRKCGGILVETAIDPATSGVAPALRYAVIGIGINVNQRDFPEELTRIATSLRIETGVQLVRQQLLLKLLRALDHQITLLEKEDQGIHTEPSLLERFAEASTWVRGKRVSVPEQGGYTGTTAGLDKQGFLLVNADDGTRRTVHSGGVREF